MKINVRYSYVTQEIIEEYYKKYFLKRAEEPTVYKTLCHIYNVFSFLLLIIMLFYELNYHPLLSLIKKIVKVEAVEAVEALHLFALSILILLFIYIFLFLTKLFMYVFLIFLTKFAKENLFQIHTLLLKQYKCKAKIKNRYGSFIHFQENIRTKEIDSITSGVWYWYLTVKYKGKNGIVKKEKLDATGHYYDIVKDEYLDFSWIDIKVNEILTDAGFPDIINSSKIDEKFYKRRDRVVMNKICKGCYAAITGQHPLCGVPHGCELGYKTDGQGKPLEECPKPKSWRQLEGLQSLERK